MKVPLRPGTKVLVSGHPAVLTDDLQFDFVDLSTTQAIGESIRNDAHNFGLNQHLHVEPEPQAAEPWITYDEETETVSAPGYRTDPYDENMDRVRVPEKAAALPKPKVQPKQESKVKAAPKKRATSKPVIGKAKKTATKGKK